MNLFSPQVWASVVRRPAMWLLFYIETALLLTFCVGAIFLLALGSTKLVLLGVPICVVASFVYFRLLGRLAWWLSESLAIEEPPRER